MGPATAIWSRVHSRDAAGMDRALQHDPGGKDASRKRTVTTRPAPKASDTDRGPFEPALASMVAWRRGRIRSGWARRHATMLANAGSNGRRSMSDALGAGWLVTV